MKKLYTIILLTTFAVSTAFSADLTGVKIYINPGHGGFDGANDRNVVTIPFELGDQNGFWESWSNLRKGLALRDMLEASNATVIISRTMNRDEDDRDLTQIAEEANANNVDAFLSIHSNALGNNTGTNYLLMLFHGSDAEPTIPDSKVQATAGWDQLIKNPLTIWTTYSATNKNVRGDFTFYGNTLGLGVLRPLTVPGFLSEGSFHDYGPETHRLLNDDYRKLEAERFYKYFLTYFNADLPQTGTISGWVKGKDQRVPENPRYIYRVGTSDQWLPLNGAHVKLLNSANALVNEYTVDQFYNGVFAFYNVQPGTYKVQITAENHDPYEESVTVTAANESTVKALMFNPDLPIYNVIPPDYPDPEQDPGVIAMSQYDFNKIKEANPDWLNGADIRKVVYNKEKLYVLTEEPKIHVVNASTFDLIKDLDLTGIAGGEKILSDINFTADGFLLACNKTTITWDEPDTGEKFKIYTWDSDDAAPRVLYQTKYQAWWFTGIIGETFAVSGSRKNHKIYATSVTAGSSKAIRVAGIRYEEGVSALGTKYWNDNVSPAPVKFSEALWGQKMKFTPSPFGDDRLIVDGENMAPTEYKMDWEKPDKADMELLSTFAENSGYALNNVSSGGNFFRSSKHIYLAVPNSGDNASVVGVVLFDVTEGLNQAKKVSEFLPQGGLGATPATYMFATGVVRNYDKDLIVLAQKLGVQRFATVAGNTNANAYASELKLEEAVDTYKLHFTLNEKITDGEIRIYAGENVVYTQPLSEMNKGVQSVDVAKSNIPEGTYNWSVTVNAPAVDRPFKFTDNSWVQLQFWGPRGVAVDNNFESPFFGRVYASETQGGTVTNRTTQDGIYILNSALEDVTNQGQKSYGGGVSWANVASPMRLAVAPDGSVFLTDWSDINSGVWKMDAANPSNPFFEVFGGLTRDGDGIGTNSADEFVHGSISHCWITGTGADTKLFTFDEDAGGNILQYNIGELTTPWQQAPSKVVYDDAANGNLQWNMNSCIYPDAQGGWWVSQHRATDAVGVPSLIHVNAAGTVDFNSGATPTLIGSSYMGGMAVTEDGKTLAIGALQNEVKIFNVTFGNDGKPTLSIKYVIKPVMGSNTAGISFDKAGNLYIISNSSERLGVWALPKAENTFTTPAPSIQKIVVQTTDVNQVDGKAKISVYPNPVRDVVTIKSEQSNLKSIEIYDLSGRRLKHENASGNRKEMDVSNLSSGAYIIQVKTEKGKETVRILKN